MTGRRAPGEGSVYRVDDGSWRGVVDLGWHGGKRRRRYVRGRTKVEVTGAIRRLALEAEEGRLRPGRAPTLGVWLERYLTEVAPATVRPNTVHRYRQEVRLYIGPALGKVPLDKLRPDQISAFYQDQLTRISAGSVRRLHALLRRALTVAVRWQLVGWNPVMAVDPPSLSRVEVQPYSEEETRQFLAAVSGSRFEARWLLGVVSGMRQGEVLGLSWQDVDLVEGTARVRQALQYQPGNGLQLVPPKTARSRRTVPLPQVTVDALRLLQERHAESRVKAGEFWEDWGLVFSTEVGTPIHPRNDYRDFQLIVERAGLRRVRLHDLRHTAASLMLAQGVPARVVMEVLGHSQISITLNTYTHVSAGLSREAADRMQLLLGGASDAVAAGLAAEDAISADENDDDDDESATD